jgi:DNA mismatch repair protein MutS2
MDAKTLQTLEYLKILDQLAGYAAFPASRDKALALRPTGDIEEARRRLAEAREAVQLLSTRDSLIIGGARDVREPVTLAMRGGVLPATDLLDIKYTLIAARTLARTFEKLEGQFPNLADIAVQMPSPPGLVDAITRAISERGEILDTASQKLGTIRRDMRIAHDRLLTKMQRIVADPNNAQFLQEALITQRDGRYVLPLRAEFKGRIKSVVHDQSSSGATLFVEPLVVVELNNQYRELQLAERDEERRILAELSNLVADYADDMLQVVEVVAELDLAFARGKYAEALKASEPVLHPIPNRPENRHPGTIIRLYQARHPLLDPRTVVPIDVELDQTTFALVITGPNTGGKTVTLKTIGLLALMAQSGLLIPSDPGSELSLFRDIFADIGDEQSIEQSLSTFSSHITNIIRILERADRRSLVIFDELGAGTDPQEGAALARSLLVHVLERGITTLVTTHHPELKAFAHTTPGVVNASVEFDLETLQPTFRLTIGLPGRSNALAIAQRLGMPAEIIAKAREELDPEQLHAEDLLDDIHRQRELSRLARVEAQQSQQEVERLRSELFHRLENIEGERREILDETRAEAEAQLKALQTELAEIQRALARARQPLDVLNVVEEKVSKLAEKVAEPVKRRRTDVDDIPLHGAIRLGDKVQVRSLKTQGVVTAIGEEEVEVQVGVLRLRTRMSDLEPTLVQPEIKKKERDTAALAGQPASMELPASPGMELDLRGQRADEALAKLDRFLDAAYLAGMPFVRIIHGKGTGALRQAVRSALGHHPHVHSFEGGGEKEGGDGVTMVKLATD